jgi:hypothetical protein
MVQYQEGKWPLSEPRDEAATDVMKFIGRSDFAPSTRSGETASSNYKGQKEIYLPTGAHPALFEYMKQFEKQSNGSPNIDVTHGATLGLIQQPGILSPPTPGITNNIQGSGISLTTDATQTINYIDELSSSLAPSRSANQALDPMNWPSNSLYNYQPSNSASLQGQPIDTTTESLLHDDLYLTQTVDPFHPNEEIQQGQIWEQFLSMLIPSDITPDPTPTL